MYKRQPLDQLDGREVLKTIEGADKLEDMMKEMLEHIHDDHDEDECCDHEHHHHHDHDEDDHDHDCCCGHHHDDDAVSYTHLEEVGKEFNVTRERIRQIEAKALRKLRHPSRSRKLKDYLD